MKNKILIIGLDGATLDIILPLIKKGKLPNFKKIIKEGSFGELESTIPPISPIAWSSLVTGVNPGKHNIFDFIKRDEKSYKRKPVLSTERKAKEFWHYINKSIIINVPMTYPTSKLNGKMIAGYPAVENKFYSYPQDFYPHLRKIFGKLKLQQSVSYNGHNEKEFIREQEKIIADLIKVVTYSIENEDWDIFMFVAMSLDTLQHSLWKYIDKHHPAYNKSKYKQTIFDFYKKFDSIIGQLINKLKNTNIMICSDHGFGPVYYTIFVNNWLLKNKYLSFKKDPWTRIKVILWKLGVNTVNLYNFIRKINLISLAEKAGFSPKESFLKKLANKLFLSFEDIDWNRTKAYSTGYYGDIYINLKGREPKGIVSKKDYEKVRQELMSKLKQISNPLTKERVFKKIYKKEELYSGPFITNAPDILFYDDDFKYANSRYLEFGKNALVVPQVLSFSGSHKLNGIFFAIGPNIKKGVKVKNAKIIDVMPTIMQLAGKKVPKHVDGRVLKEIIC